MEQNTFIVSCKSYHLMKLKNDSDVKVEKVHEYLAEGWYRVVLSSLMTKDEVKEKYNLI